ncbi:MAG: hypothetical protein ACXADB_11720 [Candidatus Hermodarchaeia archaeon]|jgi:hypothetical protein
MSEVKSISNITFRKSHQPFLWIALVILISGCALNGSSVSGAETSNRILLEQGSSVGQTFVSQYAGLSGIELFIDSKPGLNGEVQVYLRRNSTSQEDLYSTTINTQRIETDGYYRFDFEPQPDSFRRYYYVFLEFQGEGNLGVTSYPGDHYLEGALHVNHLPLNRQLDFNLSYHARYALLDFGREILYWCGVLLVALFLFVIPGLSIITLIFPTTTDIDWPSKLVLGLGISMVTYPILYLFTYLINIRLGAILAWFPGLLGTLILFWKGYSVWKNTDILSTFKSWSRSINLVPDLMTLVIVATIR